MVIVDPPRAVLKGRDRTVRVREKRFVAIVDELRPLSAIAVIPLNPTAKHIEVFPLTKDSIHYRPWLPTLAKILSQWADESISEDDDGSLAKGEALTPKANGRHSRK